MPKDLPPRSTVHGYFDLWDWDGTLVVDGDATQANGTAERDAASALTQNLKEGATLGADKGYDAASFVEGLKTRKIVPHFAIQSVVSKLGKVRGTAVPPDVGASEGYKIRLRKRKRIEEVFGWGKTVGGLAQLKVRGLDKVKAAFLFSLSA